MLIYFHSSEKSSISIHNSSSQHAWFLPDVLFFLLQLQKLYVVSRSRLEVSLISVQHCLSSDLEHKVWPWEAIQNVPYSYYKTWAIFVYVNMYVFQ